MNVRTLALFFLCAQAALMPNGSAFGSQSEFIQQLVGSAASRLDKFSVATNSSHSYSSPEECDSLTSTLAPTLQIHIVNGSSCLFLVELNRSVGVLMSLAVQYEWLRRYSDFIEDVSRSVETRLLKPNGEGLDERSWQAYLSNTRFFIAQTTQLKSIVQLESSAIKKVVSQEFGVSIRALQVAKLNLLPRQLNEASTSLLECPSFLKEGLSSGVLPSIDIFQGSASQSAQFLFDGVEKRLANSLSSTRVFYMERMEQELLAVSAVTSSCGWPDLLATSTLD